MVTLPQRSGEPAAISPSPLQRRILPAGCFALPTKKKKKRKEKNPVRWGTALSLLHTVVISFIGRSDLSIFTAILNSGTKEEQLRLYESRCL
jgi:hypothetical protein